MDVEKRFDLIKRNTFEIVGEDKLKELLKKNKKIIAYCGYEPSGPLHIGHFVTISKLIDLEKAGIKVKILLADIHALLNKKGSDDDVKKWVKVWKNTLKALGVKSEIILGSKYQFGEKYQMEVMRLAQSSTIKRGLRSMQEIARDVENASISQLWYPLMQVVDIKHLGADIAVGGLEQRKVHMIGKDFSNITNHDFVAIHTPLIDSLKGNSGKMSSSIKESLISFTDSKKDIDNKIGEAYCPQGKIEGNPVMQILKLIIFPRIKNLNIVRPEKFGGNISYESYEDVEKDFTLNKLHPMDLKKAVASELEKIISPVRKNMK